MASRLALAVACCALLSFCADGTAAAPGAKKGQITVYWGQHANEGSLRQACESNLSSTVIISFLTYVGGRDFRLSLASHPWGAVGHDIKYCQSKHVLVLLGITEANKGSKYSVPSKDDAVALARHVWDNYLGGWSMHRPFGDAVLDGVDLYDIELGSVRRYHGRVEPVDRKHIDGDPKKHHDDPSKEKHDHARAKRYDHSKDYGDLAMLLKEYSKNGKKKVWVTVAPPCPFPDKQNDVIGHALREWLFNRVHVQFYTHPSCSYRFHNEAAFAQEWNRSASGLPRSSVYMGLPASPHAARTGYVKPEALVPKVLPIVQRSHNYLGLMLWNRFWDRQNERRSGAMDGTIS